MQVTPLTTLRAPDNTYATAPLRVDALAAEAWDPIFNPAEGGRPLERIAAYFAHIKEGATHSQEFPLPAWDVDEFLSLLNQAPDRAAGLDAWAPRHWKHMTRRAALWLLCLFNLLEDGCAWPDQLQHAKAVFISKPTTAWEDPCPSAS
jgi:hypothetical protein